MKCVFLGCIFGDRVFGCVVIPKVGERPERQKGKLKTKEHDCLLEIRKRFQLFLRDIRR